MNFQLPLAGCTWAVCISTAFAQGLVPDAGALRQQIEQPRQRPSPFATPSAPAVNSETAPAASAAPADAASITVQRFRFAGNTLVADDELSRRLAGFLNRPVTFAELTQAAEAVTLAYRDAGWLARTLLPAQTIDDGVVTLQVIEARFGGVRLEGAPPKRLAAGEVEAYILHQQAGGQPLRAGSLDRGLLLADDLPGVSVAGTLVTGPGEGETSLVLQTADEPVFFGEVGLDNLGSRATGAMRKSANFSVNSPASRGELFSANLLQSQGSDYGRVALTAPYGYDGLRLGASASVMRYEVIDGPSANTAAPIRGRSTSLGLDWSAPLLRERLVNLYWVGGLDRKAFFNEDTQVRSDYSTDSIRLGFSGNRFDDFGGGGANSASAQLLWGRLGDIVAHSLDKRLEGSYRKLTYGLSRQQSLTGPHSLFVSLSGQHATQILDSAEKFYIGGVGSVRAYPSSELGGERGQVLNAEWRWRLSPEWVLAAFVDHGRVVSLPTTASDEASDLTLRGRGLSLAWQAPGGLSTRLTWAHRTGVNPKPSSTGTDSDGTLKRNRLWLSATLSF